MSHSKPKGSYIKVNDPHPKAGKKAHSYVNKYVRKDKTGVRSFRYKDYKFSQKSESKSDILPPLKEVGASCAMTLLSQA